MAVPSWHALAYVPKTATSLLDVGCNVGEILKVSRELGVGKLFGIEINKDAVAIAQKNLSAYNDCVVVHGSADALPFEDDSVDCVICSEVLEHVPENLRASVMTEIARVLKPGGRFIMTVPHKGLFAFLDPANFRLMFPRLFRMVERIFGGKGRAVGFQGEKHGIVWHHHFTMEELHKFYADRFTVEEVRFRGTFLIPVCEWLLFPLYRLEVYDSFIGKFLQALKRFDLSIDLGAYFAYNVLVTLTPKKGPLTGQTIPR